MRRQRRLSRLEPAVILARLQIIQNARKGRGANTCADNDGLVEIVEALGGRPVGPIDAHVCQGVLEAQTAQLARPVAVSLDVQLHLPPRARRDGKGMPLEEGDLRDLQEDVLARLVLPDAPFRNGQRNAYRVVVEHTELCGDLLEAGQQAREAFGNDQCCGQDQHESQDGVLHDAQAAVCHEETEHGKHQQMAELEDLIGPGAHLGYTEQRDGVEDAQSNKAAPAGQETHKLRVGHALARQRDHGGLAIVPTAPIERAAQMSYGMERRKHQGDHRHDDVEALAQIPIDEARDVVEATHARREPSRHAQHHEEERRVQRAGCGLGHGHAPAKGRLILRSGRILVALPDAQADLEAQHDREKDVLGSMDLPVAAQSAREWHVSEIIILLLLCLLVALQRRDGPCRHRLLELLDGDFVLLLGAHHAA